MDAKKIQQFYLQALYTEVDTTSRLNAEEAFVLKTISRDRLEIERAARLRNLRTVIHDDMTLLNKIISKNDFMPHLELYVASPYFWMHRGRTLVEDFCLFFANFSNASEVLKLVARIEGVHSGLSASAETKTPWQEHTIYKDGKDTVESFIAPFKLPWPILFSKGDTYIPEMQAVNCLLRRSENRVKVDFVNGN